MKKLLTIICLHVSLGTWLGNVVAEAATSEFLPATEQTKSIILCDLSGSMSAPLPGQTVPKIDAMCVALQALGTELEREPSGGSPVTLLGFTRKIDVRANVTPGPGAATQVREFATAAQKIVAENRATALYDALLTTLDDFAGSLSLSVISDGLDTVSRTDSLERFLQQASLRGVRVSVVGLGTEVTRPLTETLSRMPTSLRHVITVSDTSTLAGSILAPRILVLKGEREGVINLVAVGASVSGAHLEWRLDGNLLMESEEHVSTVVAPGSHEIALQATLPGGAVLTSHRRFEVTPPTTPDMHIRALAEGEPYIAGKRTRFMIVGASNARIEWFGPGPIAQQADTATFVLMPGKNVIEASVVFPNGATARPRLEVMAERSTRKLALTHTTAVVGTPCTVRAHLDGHPIGATIELQGVSPGNMGGEFVFTPTAPEAYRLVAFVDEEGLRHEAELTIHAAWPTFAVTLSAPKTIADGQTFAAAALIVGDDRATAVKWSFAGQDADGISAEFRAVNTSGIVITKTLEATVTTATGRTFNAATTVSIQPRPDKPVAELRLPTYPVRVGEDFAVLDLSAGRIDERWIVIDGGNKQPLQQATLNFATPGKHSIRIEVVGPGGSDQATYEFEIFPPLKQPRISRIIGIPELVFAGEPITVATEVEGDHRGITWRVAGEVAGRGDRLTWTPSRSGKVLLEASVSAASDHHVEAHERSTISVKHPLLKPIYHHPLLAATIVLCLVAACATAVIASKRAGLQGRLVVAIGQQKGSVALRGKKVDLSSALAAQGLSGVGSRLEAVLLNGHVALKRPDGEVTILHSGFETKITPDMTATWHGAT